MKKVVEGSGLLLLFKKRLGVGKILWVRGMECTTQI